MDWLMRCTKQQINKKNFIVEFSKFLKCIQRKMVKMVRPTDLYYTEGKNAYPQQDKSLKIPSFIDPDKIVHSFVIGYKHLKPKIEQYAIVNDINLDNYSELAGLY